MLFKSGNKHTGAWATAVLLITDVELVISENRFA